MIRTPYVKSLETKIEKYLESNLDIELGDTVQLLQDYIYVEIWINDIQYKIRTPYPGQREFFLIKDFDTIMLYIVTKILYWIT